MKNSGETHIIAQATNQCASKKVCNTKRSDAFPFCESFRENLP